jgi:Zn-dependent protease
MFRSLVLGRIFGVPIKLHWSFYIVLIYALLELIANPASGVGLIIMIALLSFSVIAHELAHSLVARKFRIQTHDILLTPIGGIARMTDLPATPKQEILVAGVGPLLSITIGLATFPFLYSVMFQHTEVTGFISGLFSTIVGLFALLSIINLIIGVFNLIPAFPMDGGRILRAILHRKLGILRATEIAASVGKFIALVGLVFGIIHSAFSLIIIAIFVFITSSIELSMVRRREMLKQMGGSPFDRQFQVDLMNLFKVFSSQVNQAQYYQRTPNNYSDNEQTDRDSYKPDTDYIEYKGQQVFMPDKSKDEDNNA